jgi:ribonuclease BN (tRNA processing enzyme)
VVVRTSATGYTRANLAYRMEHRGASLVYLGDSESTLQLMKLGRGLDLVIAPIVGAAMPTKPKQWHFPPSAVAELALAAGAKWLLLSHLYRDVDLQDA